MNSVQHTIKNPKTLSGVGIHSGHPVNLTFNPAPVNHGIRFKRIDLNGSPSIPADADLVIDTSRGSTLETKGVRVQTVEHVLSAIVGLEIDNILIEIDGPEIPIMDGSAQIFIETLISAGIENQNELREYFKLNEVIRYTDPENKIEIIAIPADEYEVTVMIDYDSPVLGTQHTTLNGMAEFKDEFASARTFCFLHELEPLVEANLIKGGDLDNAIVVVDKVPDARKISQLRKVFDYDIAVKEGILNNVELRYHNEPARHKLLDVIGDLALVGMPLKAKIFATRPGHAANVAFAKLIKQKIKENRNSSGVPHYDPNKTPLYDITALEKILPHKYPFLLVDKVIEITETGVVGVKNVSRNEEFFNGHFPGNPVMPGVLIIEALAQTGGIKVLSAYPDPENYDVYFLKIDNARFKNKVLPGDTLILKLELTAPIRRGICEMHAVAYVGNKIVAEADLVARTFRKEGR